MVVFIRQTVSLKESVWSKECFFHSKIQSIAKLFQWKLQCWFPTFQFKLNFSYRFEQYRILERSAQQPSEGYVVQWSIVEAVWQELVADGNVDDMLQKRYWDIRRQWILYAERLIEDSRQIYPLTDKEFEAEFAKEQAILTCHQQMLHLDDDIIDSRLLFLSWIWSFLSFKSSNWYSCWSHKFICWSPTFVWCCNKSVLFDTQYMYNLTKWQLLKRFSQSETIFREYNGKLNANICPTARTCTSELPNYKAF